MKPQMTLEKFDKIIIGMLKKSVREKIFCILKKKEVLYDTIRSITKKPNY